jgi:hypothetical protein
MHLLHLALDEDSELRNIINGLSERIVNNPLKHALVLDLNPLWLSAYRLEDAGLSPDILFELFPFRYLIQDIGTIFPHILVGGGPIDLSRKFPQIDKFARLIFGGRKNHQPFMLRIFAKPAPSNTGEWIEYRRQLVYAARETPIPTIVETQDLAQLIAAPGDRILSSSGVPGTIGGFLKENTSGNVYAVTCGHVISAGNAYTGNQLFGACSYAMTPTILPPGVGCSTSCGYVTDLDVALVDIGWTQPVNLATSVAQIVSPGDIVIMDGATSGSMRYEVGGAVIDHAIGGSCWSKLFLFHAPVNSGLFGPAVNVAITSPPKGGDSGAWLRRNGNEWVGMVVASNSLFGFALAGTHILTQTQTAFGRTFQLA